MPGLFTVDEQAVDLIRMNFWICAAGLAILLIVALCCLVASLFEASCSPHDVPNRKQKLPILAAFAFCLMLLGPTAARAEEPDSGLSKRYAISLGFYDATTLDLFGPGYRSRGFAAKADYSFFRPTSHEAVVSVWYLRGDSDGSSMTYCVGSAEYRWRFGGHGAAYWATGIGTASGSGGNPFREFPGTGGFNLTTGLGLDLGSIRLETRQLMGYGAFTSLFLVGIRF
jgi:hypothetical protein